MWRKIKQGKETVREGASESLFWVGDKWAETWIQSGNKLCKDVEESFSDKRINKYKYPVVEKKLYIREITRRASDSGGIKEAESSMN